VETFTKSGNTPIFDTAAIACLHYEVGEAGVLLEKTSPAELALRTHR
jgi:phosphohistidine phosphatase